MNGANEEHAKSSVKGFYNIWGPLYTAFRERGRDAYEDKALLLDALGPFSNDSVLDVGTGPGVYALRIAAESSTSRVVGIDISPAFIEIASRRASRMARANATFSVGDIEALDFADESFSKVICAGVVSVIGDRRAAVLEMARVLAPGGQLAVREPRRSDGALSRFFASRGESSGLRRLGSRFGLMFGHFSPDFLSETELRALFDDAGFSRVEYRPHGLDLIIIARK